jgi:ribonuclease J
MRLTIHRGTHEIGGTCIELESNHSKILIDFGLPLVDQNKEPFDSDKIRNKSKRQLIKSGILPGIRGLYDDGQPEIDGILLSHPHQDHYGLLSHINPRIPIYLSNGCKKLIEASHYFSQTSCTPRNAKTVESWKSFTIEDFTITPYLVDHSGFDALSFLIESEGKRIFYTGDFRGHGRKAILYANLLKHPPEDIDYLILEGSMIGRDKGRYETETEIENALTTLFKEESLYFIACSSQNIDRLVSVFRACIKTGRIFVIDPYTGYILDLLREISSRIPQADWGENMKIFFVPNSYTKKMGDDKILFKFKKAKITYQEIQKLKSRIVIKDNYLARNIFARRNDLTDSRLIYSMWEGYLADVESFWKENNVPIRKVHTSGHAYIDELKRFTAAIKPSHIIPNHTFHPERYSELFGNGVIQLNDKQTIDL